MSVYRNTSLFPDAALLHERDLLLAEMRDDIANFLQGIIDDHHVLNEVESEAIKRGLLEEHTPIPFLIGVGAEQA